MLYLAIDQHAKQITVCVRTADGDTVMEVTDPDNSDEVLWTGTLRWGRLRDSDPFVGSETETPQPNWCVAFEMAIEE